MATIFREGNDTYLDFGDGTSRMYLFSSTRRYRSWLRFRTSALRLIGLCSIAGIGTRPWVRRSNCQHTICHRGQV